MNLETKRQIMRASKGLIERYIFDRTVVLATHDETKVLKFGTGMLLRVDNQSIVITAAHVIKNVDPETIQLTTTEAPSNRRFAPSTGDIYGGEFSDELDVGFLRIRDSASLLATKQFLSLEDLEFFPTGLTTDLAILFGMPGTEHKQPSPGVHSFGSFTYMTSFPEDVDWSASGHRPTTLSVGYEQLVEDTFTGQEKELPAPYGMSGGGLWRARFAGRALWTPDQLRLVGILTEFDEAKREVAANRVENLYHLLASHFALPDIHCT